MGLAVITFAAYLATAAVPSQAAVVLQVDLDRTTPEIESSRVVGVGDVIQGRIFLELTETSTLAGYSFALRFNTDTFDIGPATFTDQAEDGSTVLMSRNDTGIGSLSPLTFPERRKSLEVEGVVDPIVGNAGVFNDIEAVSLTSGIPSGTSGTVFEFNLTAGAQTDAGNSVNLLPLTITDDHVFFDGTLADIPLADVSFYGASVTVVPEPSAVLGLVFTSMMLGLVRYRSGLTPFQG